MKKVIFLILSFLVFSQVHAIDIFVDVSNTNSTLDGTTWEKAYKDLSSAVASATVTDVIHIKDGTFTISAPISIGKNITIKAGYPKTNTGTDLTGLDPFQHKVIITPSTVNSLSLFVLSLANINVNIDGIHFENGGVATSAEGAIYVKETATLNLQRCVFEGNKSKSGVAIHAAAQATATIDRCVFFGNTNTSYSVFFSVVQLPVANSKLTISNSVFASNFSC